MSASQVQSTISRVINKTKRRRKGKDSASNSIISNDSDDSGDRRGLRDSIDSAIDRIKTKKADDDRPLRDSRLSSLIPGLKKSEAQIEDYQHSTDQQDERGRSISKKRALENELPASNRVNVDNDRPKVVRSLSKSSLITVDDVESLDKPPLTSHPSHAGYLTLSSPHISVTSADQTHSQPVETSAVPPIAISPVDEPTPVAAIHAESDNLAPSSRKKRTVRSRSPAGRFKEVFKTGSSKKSASPTSSPDRDSSGVGRGVVGGLFGGRKGSTSASRRGSRVLESTPPLPKVPNPEKPLSRPSTAKDRLINQPILTDPPSSPPTPTTFVTPPTPVLDTGSEFSTPPDSPRLKERSTPVSDTRPADHNSDIVISPSGHMISHRRVRSSPSNQTQTPSKLSNTSFAPLSPTIEDPKSGIATPGGQGPPGSGGFFSSVFSAAQNAATTFQNSIANNPLAPGSRSRSGTQSEPNQEEPESEEVISSFPSLPDNIGGEPGDGKPSKRPAVETLGLGDLSLSHLGISDPSSAESEKDMNSKPLGGSNGLVSDPNSTARDGRPTTPRRVETASIAESFIEDTNANSKPRSTYEQSLIGDQTPPRTDTFEIDTGIRRSGSVRSRVGAVARRKRGSSVTTGGTIAAAIGATNAALGHHSSQNSAPRLTGFAVASKKRNRDFHQLFRSVPEDDYLIEDYSAALQREILLHGRLYVSEGHICFNANIFGWVTTLVISFDEIVSLEKKSTAMVFPNAIVISTLHARNVFASFVSRDSTYDLLVGIWKISHPNLKSSANGISLDDSRGADKTVKVEESESSEGSGDEDEGDDDEMYDEDEDGEDGSRSLMTAGDGSHIGSDAGDNAPNGTRKPSALPAGTGVVSGAPANGDAKGSAGSPGTAPTSDFPGPPTHAPTSCSDAATHYDKVIKDETIPAPLGKVYSMVFGPKSGAFMTKWLTEDQKVLELQMEDDKKGLSDEIKTRSFSYIKPLNASIGPKQTKCLITETVEAFDLEKAVSITVTTQTPDVPSGNVFSVKTKYCLTWAEGNSTRLLMNCAIEWTGKSWLKGPIEKGANDGQVTYAKDLVEALRTGVSSRSRSGTSGTRGKTKGRRRKGNSDAATRPENTRDGANSSGASSKKAGSSWGPLEPLHSILEPILDIFQPLISGNFALGIVVVLVLVIWFSSSKTRTSAASSEAHSMMTLAPAERLIAYEEMWKREESELWNWLEERTGFEGGAFLNKDGQNRKPSDSSKSSKEKSMSSSDKMTEREIDNAIKVTEERLRSLKLVIERGKVDAKAKTKPKSQDAGPEHEL